MKFEDAVKGENYKNESCDYTPDYIEEKTVSRKPGDKLSDAIEKAIASNLKGIKTFKCEMAVIRSSGRDEFYFGSDKISYDDSQKFGTDYCGTKGVSMVVAPNRIPIRGAEASGMEAAILEAISSADPHPGKKIILSANEIGARIFFSESISKSGKATLSVSDFTVQYSIITEKAGSFDSTIIDANGIRARLLFEGIPGKDILTERVEILEAWYPLHGVMDKEINELNERIEKSPLSIADIKKEMDSIIKKAKDDVSLKLAALGTSEKKEG